MAASRPSVRKQHGQVRKQALDLRPRHVPDQQSTRTRIQPVGKRLKNQDIVVPGAAPHSHPNYRSTKRYFVLEKFRTLTRTLTSFCVRGSIPDSAFCMSERRLFAV